MKDELIALPISRVRKTRDSVIFGCTLFINTETPKKQAHSISWLSGFWRVSFEWRITYMFIACLDSVRSRSKLFMLSSALCQRPYLYFAALSSVLRSVFIAARERFSFAPFWESYFSISPYIRGGWRMELDVEWKTVKIINISIYKLSFRLVAPCFRFWSAQIVLVFLSISSTSLCIDAFWLLAPQRVEQRDGLRHGHKITAIGKEKWEILNKHRARDENVFNWNFRNRTERRPRKKHFNLCEPSLPDRGSKQASRLHFWLMSV